MAELSPAARAVWEAAMNTPEDMPYEHDLAAALRAAAGCLQELPESSDYCFWASSHEHGLERGIEKLNAIANELESL